MSLIPQGILWKRLFHECVIGTEQKITNTQGNKKVATIDSMILRGSVQIQGKMKLPSCSS